MDACSNDRLRPSKYGGFAMRNHKISTPARSLTALVLALCLLLSMIPASALAAASVGSASSALTASTFKKYVKLTAETTFFTGEKSGTGSTVRVPAGTVCQLLTDDWYTASDKKEYYAVYYKNELYHVLRSNVKNEILTDAELDAWIRNDYWKRTTR